MELTAEVVFDTAGLCSRACCRVERRVRHCVGWDMPSGLAGLIIVLGVVLVECVAGLGVGLIRMANVHAVRRTDGSRPLPGVFQVIPVQHVLWNIPRSESLARHLRNAGNDLSMVARSSMTLFQYRST